MTREGCVGCGSYGVFHQSGLQKYQGEWEADRRSGKGKSVYADGSEYDGAWRDDLQARHRARKP
eukprot:822477-Prorocentrum_minimum.AAC.2